MEFIKTKELKTFDYEITGDVFTQRKKQ